MFVPVDSGSDLLAGGCLADACCVTVDAWARVHENAHMHTHELAKTDNKYALLYKQASRANAGT